ncbi:MAG TPA: hypothetical protein ENK46_06845 [Flavobacteriia bacterium]|nr:hypothetical protein [Flavobacteriia bacterium]
MKTILKYSLLLVLFYVAISCSKSEDNLPNNPSGSASSVTYIAGKEGNIPTLWENATPNELADGTYTASVFSVAVQNNDVYLAGFEKKNLTKKATLWKNGEAIDLSTNAFTSVATSVTIANNDVYVVGYEFETDADTFVAKMWKNGVVTNLTNGSHDAYAQSITVINNDIYVAGYESLGANTIAKLWKNGTAINLTDGSNEAEAYSVTVNNNDVYVVGMEFINGNEVAKLWKNGSTINLSDGNQHAKAIDVAVKNNNVYVVGYNGLKAVMWINGEIKALSAGSPIRDRALGIALDNVKPIVVGYVHDGNKYVATIWKDGTSTDLSDSSEDSYAWDIYLN